MYYLYNLFIQCFNIIIDSHHWTQRGDTSRRCILWSRMVWSRGCGGRLGCKLSWRRLHVWWKGRSSGEMMACNYSHIYVCIFIFLLLALPLLLLPHLIYKSFYFYIYIYLVSFTSPISQSLSCVTHWYPLPPFFFVLLSFPYSFSSTTWTGWISYVGHTNLCRKVSSTCSIIPLSLCGLPQTTATGLWSYIWGTIRWILCRFIAGPEIRLLASSILKLFLFFSLFLLPSFPPSLTTFASFSLSLALSLTMGVRLISRCGNVASILKFDEQLQQTALYFNGGCLWAKPR